MGTRKEKRTVKNISDLRNHALETLESLVCGDMEVEDALAASKLYSNVIDTVKAEVDYNKSLSKGREISFMEVKEPTLLDAEKVAALENKFSKS